MKISFSGAQGTGKTTSVAELFYKTKLENPSKTVTILMENAKHSPYAINKNTNISSQLWIYTNQLQQELYYEANYYFVLGDRTICDAMAYSKVVGLDELADSMYELGKHHIQSYDEIIFKTIKNNDFLIDDGVRDVDRKYRQDVEDILLDIYNRYISEGYLDEKKFRLI